MLPSVNHSISKKPTTAAITVYLFSISNRVPLLVGLPATSDCPGPLAMDSHANATTTFTAASDARDLRQLGQALAARTDRPKVDRARTSTNSMRPRPMTEFLQLPSLVLHQSRATVVFAERVPIGTVSYDSV